MRDRWNVAVTAVANEFIDEYMAAANGEYVKVYLYVLRHMEEDVSVESIADALNHTESDVRRALNYWEKQGVLVNEVEEEPEPVLIAPSQINAESAAAVISDLVSPPQPAVQSQYSEEQVNRLAGDEDFSQVLYIAQKYMDRIFTPSDCQVFAYLYDTLEFSVELLEYLVEYCVQNGHVSVRYMEKVALNWHEKGLKTAEEAREYAECFNGDVFSVMKAFGLNDRRPGTEEQRMIRKWFQEYGFERELVLMACDRTISSIHSPSFRYADRILSDWKQAGVVTKQDVENLDARREQAQIAKTAAPAASGFSAPSGKCSAPRRPNQFHNFKQRDTDYDAIVMKQLKERVGRS